MTWISKIHLFLIKKPYLVDFALLTTDFMNTLVYKRYVVIVLGMLFIALTMCQQSSYLTILSLSTGTFLYRVSG